MTPDPKPIFLLAEEFKKSATLLAPQWNAALLPRDDGLRQINWPPEILPLHTVPTISVEAFAFELYLKSLYVIDKKKTPPFTHDTKQLFKSLDALRQSQIKKYYQEWRNSDLGKAYSKQRDMEFETVLEDSKDAFEYFRYIYQQPSPTTHGKGWVAGEVQVATRRVILDINPDWLQPFYATTSPPR